MKCEVAGELDGLISPANMKDGDIGEIMPTADRGSYAGSIVQAHGTRLLTVGGTAEQAWSDRGAYSDRCIRPLIPPFSLNFTKD